MRLVFLLVISFLSLTATAQLRVGTWVEDVSPSYLEGLTSCLGGYGLPFSRCGSTKVHDPISVRALSISDTDTLGIFVVIDTVGIGDDFIADVKQRISLMSGGRIPHESVHVVATHTHAGPDLQGLWGGISPLYRQRLVKASAAAAITAHFSAQPTAVFAGTAQADVLNRRGWNDVDQNISILDFRTIDNSRRIATLVNMSAHPTILDDSNRHYSSDFIHHLRASVEREWGGVTVFINGVVGDAEPYTAQQRSFAAAEDVGTTTAHRILETETALEPVTGSFDLRVVKFQHPVTNPLLLAAAHIGVLDVNLDRKHRISTQFTLFQLGDQVSGVTFPGEALTGLGQPIKERLPGKYQFFFGLTGGSYGYFIPRSEFGTISGRTTEELFSLDVGAGDEASDVTHFQLQ